MHQITIVLIGIVGVVFTFFLAVGSAWLLSAVLATESTTSVQEMKLPWFLWLVLAVLYVLAYYIIGWIGSGRPLHGIALAQLLVGQILGLPIFVPLGMRILKRSRLHVISIIMLAQFVSMAVGPSFALAIFAALGLPVTDAFPFPH